ncbi:uncharacterized protein LOC143481831 [Brachyhypopomus gauderio]|uniref:uncharacterized protein LOC143481831 n=1 Tax=Brachyhypopomus gauderio TaxID=698409 RepID=UPI0040417DD3
MGKTADLTDVQKALIDMLHKEGKPQKAIAKEAGCSQSAVSKHINGKKSGREKCGRKRCTSNRDNRSLENIVKKRPFKNLGEIHKEWTAAGVSASRATTHRRIQDMGYNCRVPCVKPHMTKRQKRLIWAKEKKNRTVAQWSKRAEQTLLQKRVVELSQQIETLHQEKENMEKTLQAEIKQLREQVASLVQSNVKMFEELQVYQNPDHGQQRLLTLMETLQSQHKELLQAQLASLRQEILSQAGVMPPNSHTGALELCANQDHPQAQEEE